TRITLPGPAPSTESRVGRRVLGDVGKQPQGQVLPAHARGQDAARRTDIPLGTTSARYRPHPESRYGEARMNWRRLFRRDEADAAQREELDFYLDITAKEYIERGMEPAA